MEMERWNCMEGCKALKPCLRYSVVFYRWDPIEGCPFEIEAESVRECQESSCAIRRYLSFIHDWRDKKIHSNFVPKQQHFRSNDMWMDPDISYGRQPIILIQKGGGNKRTIWAMRFFYFTYTPEKIEVWSWPMSDQNRYNHLHSWRYTHPTYPALWLRLKKLHGCESVKCLLWDVHGT